MASDPLSHVDVQMLSSRRESLEGSVALATLARLRPLLSHGDGDVCFLFECGDDSWGRPFGWLTLSTKLVVPCTHCELPVELQLARRRGFAFLPDAAALEAIDPATEDEEIDLTVGSHDVDLRALIEDEILLDLPLAPRHLACQRELELSSSNPTPGSAHRSLAALAALNVRNSVE